MQPGPIRFLTPIRPFVRAIRRRFNQRDWAAGIVTGVLLLAAPTSAATQATYYVSPAGNDDHPGSIAQPFATLQRARDAIRLINGNMTGDIVVYLRGGTFAISATIDFDQRDSGTNGYTVRYVNYPGESPVISGGVRLAGWTVHDATANIYKTAGGGFDFRQLYVNGEKAIRARSPNAGQWNIGINFLRDAKVAVVAQADVAGWSDPSGIEMAVKSWWAESYLRLRSLTVNRGVASLRLQPEEEAIFFQRPYPGGLRNTMFRRARYYFENAYAFIDAEGEWYRDAALDTVYYKPRGNEDLSTAEVVAPRVETLLSVRGTLDDPVHNLSFSGIAFRHSTWTRPSRYGQLNAQAFQYNVYADMTNVQKLGHPPAAVMVAAAHDVRFERNVFQYLGATGLDLVHATHDNTVVGNVFTDVSGNGISVGKFVQDEDTDDHIPYNPADLREICTRDTIANNYLTRIGTDYWGAIPIVAGYTRNLRIEHNEIVGAPYTAISVGFGWTAADNAMRENVIRYNHINGFMTTLWDGGGIYTLSKQPGTIIDENFLENGVQDQGAIYFDNGSTGISARANVITQARRYVFLSARDKYDVRFDGNYTETRRKRFRGTNCTESNTRFISRTRRPPEAAAIIANAGLQAEFRDIRGR